MGKYLLKLPKMGESIAEATITKWLKEVGDIVTVKYGKDMAYAEIVNP